MTKQPNDSAHREPSKGVSAKPTTTLAEDYGDSAGLARPVPKSGPDMRHGIALYLEEVSVV